MQINIDKTTPCYASEADVERGLIAYESVIKTSRMNEKRLLAAHANRNEANGLYDDPGAVSVIERAERAAETAITETWKDQRADSGVSFSLSRD